VPEHDTIDHGPLIHAATEKTTPVDADEVGLVDSAASNVLKRLTWGNIKETLFGNGSFHAYLSSTRSNVLGTWTSYSVVGSGIWTEIVDNGGCFSNGYYTAQKTGLHFISGMVALAGLTANHAWKFFIVSTSNHSYYFHLSNSPASGDAYRTTFGFIADMDEGDTAHISLVVANDTATVDVVQDITFFSAYQLPE